MFMASHWLFTAHYLKVACMLRLTFLPSSQDEQVESIKQLMKRRRVQLLILDLCLYAIFFAVFIVAPFWNGMQCLVDVFWALLLWLITLVSFLSMRHIYHYTKTLERIGIFADRRFMTAYVILFLCISILATVTLVINISFNLYRNFDSTNLPADYYRG